MRSGNSQPATRSLGPDPTYTLSGGTLTVPDIVNNGSFIFTGGTASVSRISGTGSTTVGSGRTLAVNHVRQSALTVSNASVQITPTGNGAASGTSVIGTVSLSGSATLDLGDNKLITQGALGTATEQGDGSRVYDGIQGQIQFAFVPGVGDWSGPGITTSKPNAINGGLETLGSAVAGEVIQFDGPTVLWGGQTVHPTDTLVMYTHTGDANLDGYVDGGDYSFIDTYLGTSDAAYYKGDFNYDGFIDGGDFAYIDTTVGATPPFATGSGSGGGFAVNAVPEPASLSVAALAAAGLLRRRRSGPRLR